MMELNGICGIEMLSYMVVMTMIAWIDLRERRIPNRLLLALIIERALFLCFRVWQNTDKLLVILAPAVDGFVVGAILCFLSILLFQTKIGAGDSKLLWTIGWCYGSDFFFVILTFLWAFLLMAIVINHRNMTKQKVAFAPIVLLAMVASGLFWTII